MAMRQMLVAAATIVSTAAGAQTSPPVAGLCARLAPQTGLKRERDGSWRVNTLGGLGAALFGGTTGATFLVEPVEGSTPDQHLDKACTQAGTEIACKLVGPARITVGTKRGNATADVASGEAAQVGMKSRYLTCRDDR